MAMFSTEMVSKYHPDKYADQISDAVLTEILKNDPKARVACECLVKDKTVVLAGEITSKYKPDYNGIVSRVASDLGYHVDKVLDLITEQSPEIGGAVDADQNIGAGDQGMMFGYAVRGGKYFLPYGLEVAVDIVRAIEADVRDNPESILRGDAKTQVTTCVADGAGYAAPIDTILVSACHDDNLSLSDVRSYLMSLLERTDISMPRYLLLNPAGTWTFGGPAADCGLTGRKIVCDQYGGYAPVGGGAFSGKDPSKVDRSACYMARRIAVDMVKSLDFQSCTVQLAYAIGVSEPVSVSAIGIDSSGKAFDISDKVKSTYDLTPIGIINYLGLSTMDYYSIAGGNHMIHFI